MIKENKSLRNTVTKGTDSKQLANVDQNGCTCTDSQTRVLYQQKTLFSRLELYRRPLNLSLPTRDSLKETEEVTED